MPFLVVFVGAGVGGCLRHAVNLLAAALLAPASFPFGTMAINIAGSFVMGLVVEYFATRNGLPPHSRLFLTTGVLGGFTTFSTFSLDAALLYERGEIFAAVAYVLISVVVSLGAIFAGLALARLVLGGETP